MKKINVIKEKCLGCGACVSVAPENFDFDDDGICTIKDNTVTENAIKASNICPVFAIEILDDSENKETSSCSCDGKGCCGNTCNCGK